jgi:hypothetical protein
MVDTSNTAAAGRSIAPRLRPTIGIGLTALGVAVALTVMIVILALPGASRPTTPSQPPRHTIAHARRTSRLDAAEWATVQNAVRLRTMALAPGRTALYRSFAAYMGLSALISLHPIRPGRCATAVSYLYDNLLDVHDAYPGEDWRPLRRLIRKQPPLSVCAPKPTPHVTYAGYPGSLRAMSEARTAGRTSPRRPVAFGPRFAWRRGLLIRLPEHR